MSRKQPEPRPSDEFLDAMRRYEATGDKRLLKQMCGKRMQRVNNRGVTETMEALRILCPEEMRALYEAFARLGQVPDQLSFEGDAKENGKPREMRDWIIHIARTHRGIREHELVSRVCRELGLDPEPDDNRRRPYAKMKTLAEEGVLRIAAGKVYAYGDGT